MSSFKDTSNWKIKDRTTLVYPIEYKGGEDEGEVNKKPNTLTLQIQRLSVVSQTAWTFGRYEAPEQERGFYTYEYISALGILDNCWLHAISLDDSKNEMFAKLHVELFPAPLEKLRDTSKVDVFSVIGNEDEKPEDGWMKDEIGSIHFHGEGEYYDEAEIFASLFLSEDKFNDLVFAIKAGGIRSARMEIIADVYGFGYESLGSDIRGHKYNYAILCEDEGTSAWGMPKGATGQAKARLEKILLEWAPNLDLQMAARRDEPDDDYYLEPEMASVERDIEKVVARLSFDVQGIRKRLEAFYQAAIVVVIILIVTNIIDWMRI